LNAISAELSGEAVEAMTGAPHNLANSGYLPYFSKSAKEIKGEVVDRNRIAVALVSEQPGRI
jgi:hypothetical protein